MSGFGFSEEQEIFRKMVHDFAQKEIAPSAKEWAKRREEPEQAREWARRVAEVGLLGLGVPTKYGGQGADWVTLGIAVDEMSRAGGPAGAEPVLPALLSMVIGGCSEEIRQKYLTAMGKGEFSLCLAVTEPHCGSDAVAIKTTAIRDGDYYVLNGEKTSISGGMIADGAMLTAKTDPTAGYRGITFFLVPFDLPGVSRSRFSDMGWHAATRASIFLDNVHLPADHCLSEPGKGFYALVGQFNVLRVYLAMSVLGAAQASLEETINYAKQRTAFGQPIARFEGVSFKIAEHATYIEAARLLCYRALWLADQGIQPIKEAAMCKWFCPVVAVNAIHDCLLIHGHVAYSEDYPIEQRLRDAIGYEMADGTAQIMKLIIAGQLIGRESRPY